LEAPLRKEAIEKIKSCKAPFQDFSLRVSEHTQLKDRQRRKSAEKNQSEPKE
jgi:hypothetical protein